ncbi:MAG TPA: S8 family serine peptidase [Solirubrobacterales bacterium]
MKRLVLCLAALACAAAALLVPAGASAATDRYIVVLDGGADAASVASGLGLDTGHVYRDALDGFSTRMSPATAAAVEALPVVDYVQEDKRVKAFAQSTPTGINRADADLSPTAAIGGNGGDVDVDVAVIDTGVQASHPDLRVTQNKNCSLFGLGGAGDQNGHGTHVAGTIGALDNQQGVVGMAPGARIWNVRVLNAAGIGFTSDIVCGIDYVTANAGSIEVANMSLGGGGSDDGNCGRTDGDAEHEAICEAVGAGVTFAVAAGNDSQDAADTAPASYDEVITVSALADFNGQPGGGAASTCTSDQDDTFASFSNFGADVDVIAPGVCINSTWMGSGYNTISGTSMASPHVAGAAALYESTHPGSSPAETKAALQSAGTLDWSDADDPDPIKERLLNVSGF